MNVFKLKKEYENRIEKIRAWNKFKEPKYVKTIKCLTIFLGVILSSAIIFSTVRFKSDINKQIIWIVFNNLFFLFGRGACQSMNQ